MGKFLYGEDKILLPDIYSVYPPELQKTHPFAVISEFPMLYYLTFYSAPVYHETNVFGNYYKSNEACSAISHICSPQLGDDAWMPNDDGNAVNVPAGESIGTASSPRWANFDLPSTNLVTGVTEYIEASDPIPVLNPTAILMGYSMGAKL